MNCRLIELKLPPVRCASQEGLGYYTGSGGGLHRGEGVASRLEFPGCAVWLFELSGWRDWGWWSVPNKDVWSVEVALTGQAAIWYNHHEI